MASGGHFQRWVREIYLLGFFKLLGLRKGLHAVIMVATWIAAVALAFVVVIIVFNVIGRYFLKMPLQGTVEIVELGLVVAVFFSIAYTELKDGHVTMDEVVTRFPKHARAIVISVMHFAAAIYFFVMAWRDGVLAQSYIVPMLRETDVLHIPIAPFIIVISIGSMLLSLELLLNGFSRITPEKNDKKK
jgi:TRAP-type C4-dicarboxylate transport system permease small subunit